VARMAAQIDVLSGGRFILGMGAGWNVPEHEAFGLPFQAVRERMDRLEESIRVVRALWAEGPANFEGRYYTLKDALCEPKPAQRPMPLLVGGSGEKRTLKLVARYADEWNGVGLTAESYRAKRAVLEQHCAAVGRDPRTIRHSQMTGFIIGRTDAEQRAHLASVAETLPALGRNDPAEVMRGMRTRGWLVGTPDEVVQEIGRRQDAGLSRMMLQHQAQEDFATLELIARDVLPQVK